LSEAHRIAYVVPTKDRPDDLRIMLASLVRQTVQPHQIVIVDGSDPVIDYLCAEFPSLKITYVRCFPPSLSKQRNAGMSALAPDITLAGYLDDDLELDDDATEKMLAFWQSAGPSVGGAALTIRNQSSPRNSIPLRFFGLTAAKPGRVLSSSFPVAIPFVTETIRTEWLYGGATIWRREIVNKVLYDEWYEGHGFLEDVDYSYRVSRSYELYVVGDSRCMHYSRPLSDSRQRAFGQQQIYNRVYFVRKMRSFSSPAVVWALLGTFIMNVGALVRHADQPRRDRVLGNLDAVRMLLRGRTDPVAAYWK
jgi:GT2 family glycosyltransferase